MTGGVGVRQKWRETPARFRKAFDDAPLGMALVSSAGRFLQVNPALCRILGYTEAQLLSRTVEAIADPQTREAIRLHMRELLAGETRSFQLEQRYVHGSGSLAWALITGSLLSDRRTRSLSYILLFDDLTDRLRVDRLRSIPTAVTRALAGATALDDAGRRILQTLCEESGWQVGELWILDRGAGVLRFADSWPARAEEGGDLASGKLETTLSAGIGLPGRVWASGEPVWIEDVGQDPDAGETPAKLEAGTHGAVAFPILNGTEVTGVVSLYGQRVRRAPDDLLGMVVDIGSQIGQFIERKRAESALQESAEHIRAVLDNVADGVITTDEAGLVESLNRAGQKLFGYRLTEVVGQDAKMLIAESSQGEFISYLSNYMRPGKGQLPASGSREMWGRRKDGSHFPMEFRARQMLVGAERRIVGILRDVSEHRAQTEALEYQALHDALTGLPNRTLFNDRLRQAILTGNREKRPLFLLIMDIDRFKEVNDSLGHHVGDLLLHQVALRLEEVLRQSDTVARLGGDEFAVLAVGGADLEGGATTARKILDALELPFVVDDRNIDVRASIGIAIHPEHGEDAETLMRHADVAMYVAKRTKRGYTVYAPKQDEHSAAHLTLVGELRHAIGHDELVLYYQPKVELETSQTVGVEALVRWRHPKHGLMLPSQFIPAAEQTELVAPLARWVLNQALRQLRSWRQQGVEIEMAVNLSAWNLHDPELPAMTSDLLKTWGIEPARLRLEITESSIMAASAIETITRLSDLGVALSIDDFGTGYSSLSYLKRLPANEVKIDKSFVIGMLADSEDASIVRPIIDLAHNMGLRVVAEGVENQQTWDRLAGLGCDFAQGNHICPPALPADVVSWLDQSRLGLGRALG